MNSNNDSLNGVIAVVIASILWGTTGTAASFTADVSPLATGAFAMGFGGILLVMTSLTSLRRNYTLLVKHFSMLLFGGLAVAIYPLAFYSSMRLSGVAIGTVVSIASAPFFSVLLERFINKKEISLQWVVSFIFGVVGVVMITLGKQGDSIQNHSHDSWGILLGCVAGLTYAIYSWTARNLIKKRVSSDSAMAGQFGMAALMLLPSLWFTGEHLFENAVSVSVALYMAVIPMFLGYLLFGYALKHIEASRATLITLLEPVMATLFAIGIVGESFSATGISGMVAIGICMTLQTIRWPKITRVSNSF